MGSRLVLGFRKQHTESPKLCAGCNVGSCTFALKRKSLLQLSRPWAECVDIPSILGAQPAGLFFYADLLYDVPPCRIIGGHDLDFNKRLRRFPGHIGDQ